MKSCLTGIIIIAIEKKKMVKWAEKPSDDGAGRQGTLGALSQQPGESDSGFPLSAKSILAVAAFAIVGLLWIFASDSLVDLLSSDPTVHQKLQTLKGVVFVLAASAAFLYILYRREQEAAAVTEKLTNTSLSGVFSGRAVAGGTAFYRMFEQAPTGLFICHEGKIIAANPAFARMTGFSPAELVDRQVSGLFAESDRIRLDEAINARSNTVIECRLLRKNGAQIPVELRVQPDPEDRSCLIAAMDMSYEVALDRVNRHLRVVHQCNEVLVHAVSETELLQKMCDVFASAGGYRLAWIGYWDNDEAKTLRVVAKAGPGSSYVERNPLSWDGNSPNSRSRIITALRERKTVIIPDLLDDPDFERSRDLIREFGFRSVVAAPLCRKDGEPFGNIAIYSGEPGGFQPADIDVFEELAGDIAFGIETSRMRVTIQHDEEMLKVASSVMATAQDGLIVVDARGEIISVNPSFSILSGYDEQELKGTPASEVLLYLGEGLPVISGHLLKPGQNMWQGNGEVRKPDGSRVPCLIRLTTLRGLKEPSHIVSVRETSFIRLAEAKLERWARYDRLTETLNRVQFQTDAERSYSLAVKRGEKLAAVVVDIDRFRTFKETLGTETGDSILRSVANRLRLFSPAPRVLGRTGDDEFSLLIEVPDGDFHARAEVERLFHVLSEPVNVDGRDLFTTVSAGVATMDTAMSADELVQNAAIAERHATSAGGNQFMFYEPDWKQRRMGRFDIEDRVRQAIKRNEIELHYQPVYDLKTRRIAHVEALARWTDPELGPVSPGDFIPIAEDNGLILTLCDWSIETVCKQVRDWHAGNIDVGRIAMNLTAREFHERDLLRWITSRLERYQVEGRFLGFEITEGSAMRQVTYTMAVLKALKALGAWISIDDFGTGYSSFNYLTRFPIDELKIDASFIRGLETSAENQTIVRSIIDMAHNLNLSVVAEGVETLGQMEWLEKNGCNRIQGYLYSKALNATELASFILENHTLGNTA